MKSLTRYFQRLMLGTLLVTTMSCEDFALGEKFLQKPPSSDVTIDTIFLRRYMRAVYCGTVMVICHTRFGRTTVITTLPVCGMAYWKA